MVHVGTLLQGGQAEEALRILEEELARGADPERSAPQRIEAYLQLGRTTEALAELKALLVREPDNTAALLSLARTQRDLGRHQEALAALERVTVLQPNHAGSFAAKGRLLFEMGQRDLAVKALERAVELGMDDFELRYLLGQGLITQKRWAEARDLFRVLVVERADHGDAWLEYAIALSRTDDLPGADQALAKAKAAGNGSPKLLADVERVLKARNERRKAEQGGEAPR
jgi:tetratricopeptide (TPR) repeat protein